MLAWWISGVLTQFKGRKDLHARQSFQLIRAARWFSKSCSSPPRPHVPTFWEMWPLVGKTSSVTCGENALMPLSGNSIHALSSAFMSKFPKCLGSYLIDLCLCKSTPINRSLESRELVIFMTQRTVKAARHRAASSCVIVLLSSC